MTLRYFLEVPARPEHLPQVRLFMASIGREHGLEGVDVEDLRLGVSEAAALLMRDGSSANPLSVEIAAGSGTLGIVVRRRDSEIPDRTTKIVDEAEVSLGLSLIEALLGAVGVERVGDAVEVRIDRPLRPEP